MKFEEQRERLVEHELRLLGIRDEAVLRAMKEVPREAFVANEMQEFAYRNARMPIDSGQTISQPFVAHMAEALELAPDDKVLEIGAGSGYAAAVLSRIAKKVYTIERLKRLGYENVEVRHGDGTRGWPEKAPFDAIVVAPGGPGIPAVLLRQLSIGGRLVIPVGEDLQSQQLIRAVRRGEDDFEYDELGAVRFVPLIGEAGWPADEAIEKPRVLRDVIRPRLGLPDLIRDVAEPFDSIETADFGPLLDRVGSARVVLIGEATHGTSEFYRIRAEITKALIERKDFNFVAVEADWPDAYRIHDFVTHKEREEPHAWEAFARFPTWMWRNHETLDFIHWLREHNLPRQAPRQRVGFYALDLYSLFTSIHRVLQYLEKVDPEAAEIARIRYGCLTPWEGDPANYGRAALTGRYRNCEAEAVRARQDLLKRRVDAAMRDGEELFDAQVNARLVTDAEEYYRIMYYGSDESWNHRPPTPAQIRAARHSPRRLVERTGPSHDARMDGTCGYQQCHARHQPGARRIPTDLTAFGLSGKPSLRRKPLRKGQMNEVGT